MSGIVEESTKSADQRVTRTRRRLGAALIALLHERPLRSISVQQLLRRARVGRATFYDHYRDKDDLFVSEVDEHVEYFATLLLRSAERSTRVAPVREFIGHVTDAHPLYDRLAATGRLPELLELTEAHFARSIEQRLAARGMSKERRTSVAIALAGALISLLRASMTRSISATPEELDALFHSLVPSS